MNRIPLVAVEDLTPEQRDRYDNAPGGKLSMARLLAHAVTIQPGLAQAVQGMVSGIEVPPLERQICVLAVDGAVIVIVSSCASPRGNKAQCPTPDMFPRLISRGVIAERLGKLQGFCLTY